jgi:hypothetical protein
VPTSLLIAPGLRAIQFLFCIKITFFLTIFWKFLRFKKIIIWFSLRVCDIVDPKMMAKDTVWTHMCYFVFYYNLFMTCWNWGFWPWHVPDMLKLMIVTIKYSRHAETDMLKLTILTMTYYSHSEADNLYLYHDTFLTCWNWQFWPGYIPVCSIRCSLVVEVSQL